MFSGTPHLEIDHSKADKNYFTEKSEVSSILTACLQQHVIKKSII